MSKPTFRLLTIKDVAIFRKLRLRGCREEPAAFLEALEDIAKLPVKHFSRHFENGWIAGAFINGELVGNVGLFRHRGRKIEHKGTVWGVYVIPEARGKGIARRCIKMVLREAEQAGIELAMLSTNTQNPASVELYKSLGFEPWGIEKHILKLEDRYVDDVVMTKFLTKTKRPKTKRIA